MSEKKTMIKLTDVDIAFHIQENGFVSLKDFALNIGKHSFFSINTDLDENNLILIKQDNRIVLRNLV